MIIETGANGFNLLIPLLSFSVNVTLQAFLFRSRSCGLLKSEYIGFTLGLVLLLSLQISLHPMLLALTLDALAIVIVNLLIFCGLSYCYFHFINPSMKLIIRLGSCAINIITNILINYFTPKSSFGYLEFQSRALKL